MAKRMPNRSRKRKRSADLPEFAQMIEALRVSLDKNQKGLAEELEVSPGAVSAWLRGDEMRRPSPAAYIRMANKSPHLELAKWFLSAAGLDIEMVRSLRIEATKEFLKSIPEGTEFELPGTDVGGMFREGEIIFLEKNVSDPRTPLPFWDEVVLVRFSLPANEPYDPRKTWRNLPHSELYIGRLSLMRSASHSLTYLAVAGTQVSLGPTWERRDEGICIGGWTYKPVLDEHVTPKDRLEAEVLADKKVRLYDDCEIVGRVTRWIASPWRHRSQGGSGAAGGGCNG
jgi:transcriptional regulator with XRE-family HTH domain